MRLQQFFRGVGAHFAGDDAYEVVFQREDVDGGEAFVLDNEFQQAAEGLVLAPLPVEVDADGDFLELKSAVCRLGGLQYQGVEGLVLPADLPVGVADGLRTLHVAGIDHAAADVSPRQAVVRGEVEMDFGAGHDADFDNGFVCDAWFYHRVPSQQTSFNISSISWLPMRRKSSSRGRMNTPPRSTDAGLHSRRALPSAK